MQETKRVAEVLGAAVADISSTNTLRDAAEELSSEHVGALLVIRPAGTAGVLSERDIVRALSEGADPDEERVGDWCTDDLLRCDGETTLEDAIRSMQDAQVRHIVVDVAPGEARIVSLRELVRQSSEPTPA